MNNIKDLLKNENYLKLDKGYLNLDCIESVTIRDNANLFTPIEIITRSGKGYSIKCDSLLLNSISNYIFEHTNRDVNYMQPGQILNDKWLKIDTGWLRVNCIESVKLQTCFRTRIVITSTSNTEYTIKRDIDVNQLFT